MYKNSHDIVQWALWAQMCVMGAWSFQQNQTCLEDKFASFDSPIIEQTNYKLSLQVIITNVDYSQVASANFKTLAPIVTSVLVYIHDSFPRNVTRAH